MATHRYRTVALVCAVALLSPLAVCADDSHRGEKEQMQDRRPSAPGAARTGKGGKGGSPRPRYAEDDECDCSMPPSRDPMTKEGDKHMRQSGMLKWDPKGKGDKDYDMKDKWDPKSKGADKDQWDRKEEHDGKGKWDSKAKMGKEHHEEKLASRKEWHKPDHGKKELVKRNRTSLEKPSNSTSSYRGDKKHLPREGKPRCDCAKASAKASLVSKKSKDLAAGRSCKGRSGKGGGKSDQEKKKGGRFLQSRSRDDNNKDGCDDDEDDFSVEVVLALACAVSCAFCVTVGLLCLCFRRCMCMPNAKVQNVQIQGDVKKTTCEGVVPTSAVVVLGNPVSNKQ